MIYTLSNNTFEILQLGILAIIQGAVAVLWLLMHGIGHLWSYRRLLAIVGGVACAVVVCWACPALPLGLGITAVVGWVSYPRSAVSA